MADYLSPYLKVAGDTFWSEWFWCPANVTWKAFENKDDGIYHPQIAALLIPFPVAILLYVLRHLFERFIATTIGQCFGLKHEIRKAAPPNRVFEDMFKDTKNPSQHALEALSKQTDTSIRQVERWFRIRRNQERPDILKKFNETCWRFTFYVSAFTYGLVVLWNKPWFWQTSKCWHDWPYQHIPSDIYWYYMIELGFYWSLLITQFTDVRRKDFCVMFAHHVATIFLMVFSWADNFVRIGSLVLVVHDAVDFWLEIAKLSKYVGALKLGDIFSGMFGLVWFLTRIVLYPTWVIRSSLFESYEEFGFVPASFFFNALLIMLYILHVWWFSILVKFVYSAITSKEANTKDSRSESDEPVSHSEDEGQAVSTSNHNHAH